MSGFSELTEAILARDAEWRKVVDYYRAQALMMRQTMGWTAPHLDACAPVLPDGTQPDWPAEAGECCPGKWGDQVVTGLIMRLMLTELRRSETVHPTWPKDVIHQVLIVAEEMGEAQRAVLQLVEAREDGTEVEEWSKLHKNIDDEMIQVGAMALKFMIHRRAW